MTSGRSDEQNLRAALRSSRGPHPARPTVNHRAVRSRGAPGHNAGSRPSGFLRTHRTATTIAVVAILVAGTALAALLIRMDVVTTPSAVASDVIFEPGADYATLNAYGFVTLTIGTSKTSAELDVNGIPGAAVVQLGSVLKLTNEHATNEYNVTLTRSDELHGSIDAFEIVVKDGVTPLATWDAATSASSATFKLEADTSLDLTVRISIADGIGVSALGDFDMQFEITPAPA